MHPNYISGLVQADGSFFVCFEQRAKSKHGLRFRPKFSLTLHISSLETLSMVQHFFNGSGKIYMNKKKEAAELVIDNLDQLLAHVIPHFHNYPLYSTKLYALKGFETVVQGLKAREHYTLEGLVKLVNLSIGLNSNAHLFPSCKTN